MREFPGWAKISGPNLAFSCRFISVLLLALTLLVKFSEPAIAQEAIGLAAKLDNYFSSLAEAREFEGTVLVRRGDEILYARAFGSSGKAAGAEMELDTRLAIASLTKTFTSGAILTLISDGKVALDDPLSRFIPDFPRGDEITVRWLLMHASGLQDPDVAAIGDRALTSAELVADIATRPLFFSPGSEDRYSNAGFNVLARIIEIASGMSYAGYLEEKFWVPLGMRKIYNGGNLPEGAILRNGHIPGPEGPVPIKAFNYTAALGSGSLLAAAPDLGRWLMAVGDKKFFNIFGQGYPYGWGRVSVIDHDGIEQTGAVNGYVSVMQIYPKERLAVVVLSNVENGSWARWGRDVATIAFGGSAEAPATPEAEVLHAEMRTSLLGTYQNDDQTAQIRNENGYIWAYWNDFPKGKYLKHIGDGVFAIPSDWGRIRFRDMENGLYQGFDWEFPSGDKISLSRIE